MNENAVLFTRVKFTCIKKSSLETSSIFIIGVQKLSVFVGGKGKEQSFPTACLPSWSGTVGEKADKSTNQQCYLSGLGSYYRLVGWVHLWMVHI